MMLNRASEVVRRDSAEPEDELTEEERQAILAHVDLDDEDMT